MNWNEITQGIDHISGKHITLSTNPSMKVDIDGEINLEHQLRFKYYPKRYNFLLQLNKIININFTYSLSIYF